MKGEVDLWRPFGRRSSASSLDVLDTGTVMQGLSRRG
jgi:hypothetical protein